MRLLAAAALERDMIDIFLKGQDIHMGNAALVFGYTYEEIAEAKALKESKGELTPRQKEMLLARSKVKIIGFGQHLQ